jgi:iron complex outermembrane recepter protein
MSFRSQIFGIALLEIALFPGTVLAQITPPTPAVTSSDEGLAEIVVTAEKRSQNLQRSPVAITDMAGDDLVRLGLNDIASASVLVPSVAFTFISSELHLYIRGIGAEQDRVSIDQLVSYSIDGVNIPHEITGNNFFDVHDVEVLPGPQSTLYGNGGAGGAVVIANNRPKTDRFEISTLLEAGNYAFGHNTSVINVHYRATSPFAPRWTMRVTTATTPKALTRRIKWRRDCRLSIRRAPSPDTRGIPSTTMQANHLPL